MNAVPFVNRTYTKGELILSKMVYKKVSGWTSGWNRPVPCNMLLSKSPGTCSRPLIPTRVAGNGWPIADNKLRIENEASLCEEIFSFVFLALH